MTQSKKKKYLIAAAPVICAAAILFAVILGRSKPPHAEKPDPYTEVFTYDIQNVSTFCVDENGTVYLVREKSNEIEAYNSAGEFLTAYPVTADGILEITNERTFEDSGRNIRTTVIDELAGLCCQGKKVYCYRDSTKSLLCLDTETGTIQILWQGEDRTGETLYIKDMTISGDTILALFLGEYDEQDAQVSREAMSDSYSYIYTGERVGFWNLLTGEWNVSDYRNLIGITAKGQNSFLVEGYDAENHFYIAELSPDGIMGKKYVTGMNVPLLPAWDEDEQMLHAASFNGNQQCISGTLDSLQTAYRYFPNDLCLESVRWSNGYFYLLNGTSLNRTGQITRLKPELFFKDSRPLKAYLTRTVSEPDWQGYPVQVEALSLDELALKLLAEDSDFDFVILTTSMEEAWNMKRVMAYYPLNSSIGELLKNCFPVVQKTALNGDDIWMLPLSMNLISLVYSEENLNNAGTSMSTVNSLHDLVSVTEALHSAGLDELYSLSASAIRDLLMQDYVCRQITTGHVSFHTAEFESILNFVTGIMENEAIASSFPLSFPYARYQTVYSEVYNSLIEAGEDFNDAADAANLAQEKAFHQDILLELAEYPNHYVKYIGLEKYSILPIPGLDSQNTAYPAIIELLVVNPNSSALDDALELVNQIALKILPDPENYLTADRELYPSDEFSKQLYTCCTNAEIYEVLPSHLYEYYYINYFNGTLERDEMLDEMERVINAYYFE